MRKVVFFSLAIIFLVSPYFQGLFFESEIYYVSVVVGLLYILLVVHLFTKKTAFNVTKLSFLFILPVLYLLSFFYAESPLGSLHLSIRWIMYVSFFVLLYWSTNGSKRVKTLPIILQLTGIWIALHTFLNVVGWIDFTDALLGGGNRYSGVFQYPNTFGILMIALFLFSLMMLSDKKISKAEVALYAAPLTLYLFMLIGSFSRGSFLVFPFAFIIAFFLLDKSFRKSFLVITASTIVPAFFLLLNFTPIIHLGLLILLSFITVSIVFQLRGTPLFHFKIEIITSLVPVITLFIVDIFIHGSLKNMFPFSATDKVDSLSSGNSFWTRLFFNLDAFKMSNDSPFIGHGGEGWIMLYRNYQSYPYQTNKIHNGFLEFLVDLGWFGFIIFVGALVALLIFVFQNYRRGQEKALHGGVLVAILALFAHSVIDFDFGFATIWFFVFWLFAMSLGAEEKWGFGTQTDLPEAGITDTNEEIEKTSPTSVAPALMAVLGIVVLIGSVLSFQFILGEQAVTKAEKTDALISKEKLLENATKKNKWNKDYMFSLAETKLNIGEHNNEQIETIINDIIRLEPNSVVTYDIAGTLYEAIGNDQLAFGNFMVGLQMDRYNATLYSKTIQLLMKNGTVPFAETTLELFDTMKATYDELMENPPGKRYNKREFEFYPDILLNVGTAYYLTGDNEKIEALTSLNEDEDVQNVLLALYYVSLEKNQDTRAIAQFEEKYQANFSNIEPIIGEWRTRLQAVTE